MLPRTSSTSIAMFAVTMLISLTIAFPVLVWVVCSVLRMVYEMAFHENRRRIVDRELARVTNVDDSAVGDELAELRHYIGVGVDALPVRIDSLLNENVDEFSSPDEIAARRDELMPSDGPPA